MAEEWRAIPDFPGYEVSDHGRVRSYWRRTGFQTVEIVSDAPRMLSYATGDHRYPCVRLKDNGRTVKKYVHSLVLTAFVGPRPKGLECRHLDGNPRHNYLANLQWGTRAENVHDAIEHGTFDGITGAHARRKFNARQVEQIRQEHSRQGTSTWVLAEKWGASKGVIYKLCTGQTYRDCPGPIAQINHYRTHTPAEYHARAQGE